MKTLIALLCVLISDVIQIWEIDEDFNSIAMCTSKRCDTDKGDFWLIFFEMTDTLAHIPVTI